MKLAPNILRPVFRRAALANWLFVGLIVLWATELFVVQELTLEEHHYYRAYQPLLHQVIRGALDVLACVMMVLVLPRLMLAAAFAFALVFYGVVLAYHAYADKALTATMMSSTASEGATVTDAGLSLLPGWFWILLVTFVIKLAMLHAQGWRHREPWTRRWRSAAVALLLYVGIINVAQLYKPFTLLGKWETVGGIGSVYGYAPTWIAEAILLDNERILERALDRARTERDLLTPVEAPLPMHERVIFLQVESLDLAAIDFRIDGREVTPRLNALRDTSMFYAVQSVKMTGSADADFTALMGKLPSIDVPNYKILGFPYDDSLVHRLNARGVETLAIHNVTGDFFNRRESFGEIGFDEVVFLEELERDAKLQRSDWAVLDHEMLDYAAHRVAADGAAQLMLVITATSHVPFNYTPHDRRVFFPDSEDRSEAYFDAMHYVDASIGAFIAALPEGTTVVVYGDHSSNVTNEQLGYAQIERDGAGLVPLFLHNVGEDLSQLQRTGRNDGLAVSGDVTLLDAMTYLHRQLLANPAR